ncbi:MAG: HD domain-containing phosphohydrolase [Desulfobulbus sp.]|jgi:PAS domain S-box-containing protein
MKTPKLFQQESRLLHHHRVYMILSVYLVLTLLFALLDARLHLEQNRIPINYRVATVFVLSLLLAANGLDRRGRLAGLIGFAGYLWCGITSLLVLKEHTTLISPHYVALLVTMAVYMTLAPISAIQSLFAGLLLTIAYAAMALLSEPLVSQQLITLFTHLFFITAFVLISATQSGAATTARLVEYRLRQAENEASARLAQQAARLEKEAAHQAGRQRLSEQRYQVLFESLADDVLLVDSEGRLLQANTSYLDRFHGGRLTPTASLLDVVAEEDRDRVQSELLTLLDQGESIVAWDLTLHPPHGEPMEVEISGSLLHRGDKKLGLQLMLRDTGIRKQLEQDLLTSLKKMRQTESAAILALAKLSEYRDITPGNHLERIREYCRQLASDLTSQPGYSATITPLFIQNLYQGSILHDIGKVSVPDEILNNPGPLNEHETALLQQHTLRGGDIIKEMEQEAKGSSFLSLARNIAYFHHERWDGQGYPKGLREEHIPLEARILRIADAYEEMTVPVDPARRLTHAQAVAAITAETGAEFDPALVAALLRNQNSFAEIHRRLPEPEREEAALLPPEFQNGL